MAHYRCAVCLKQFRHLGLRQPYGLILHADIYLSLSVLGLIYDNFVLFHNLFLFTKLVVKSNNKKNLLFYLNSTSFSLSMASNCSWSNSINCFTNSAFFWLLSLVESNLELLVTMVAML